MDFMLYCVTEKFSRYIRKRMQTNPRKGPFHFRAPSKIFYKAVKGMIPHKTKRGTAALERLKVSCCRLVRTDKCRLVNVVTTRMRMTALLTKPCPC